MSSVPNPLNIPIDTSSVSAQISQAAKEYNSGKSLHGVPGGAASDPDWRIYQANSSNQPKGYLDELWEQTGRPIVEGMKRDPLGTVVSGVGSALSAINPGLDPVPGGGKVSVTAPTQGMGAQDIANRGPAAVGAASTIGAVQAGLPMVPRAIKAGATALGGVGADPELLTWQALSPRGGIGEHYSTAGTVMGDIKSAANRRQWSIQSARELKPAIDAAQNDNRAAFGQHWSQVSSPIPLDHIGDLIEKQISPETQRLASLGDPDALAEIQGIKGYAQSFRGQSVTPDQFRALQEQVNAESDVFEKKSDEKQAALIAKRGGEAMLKAKAQGYRDLTRQFAGDDAADLQYRYGRLKDWESATLQAMDRAGKEKAGTLVQKAGKVADIPGKTVMGQAEQIPTDLAGGKTDAYIKWAFDKTQPGKPLPLPGQLSSNPPPYKPPAPPSPPTGGPGENVIQFPGVPAPKGPPAGNMPDGTLSGGRFSSRTIDLVGKGKATPQELINLARVYKANGMSEGEIAARLAPLRGGGTEFSYVPPPGTSGGAGSGNMAVDLGKAIARWHGATQ